MLGTHIHAAKGRDDAMRFVNAYHHLAYLDQGGVGLDDALHLVTLRRLLTPAEAENLAGQDCDSSERLLIWACSTITRHAKEQGLADVHVSRIIDLVLDVRRNASFIKAYDSQPIPFCYYHFMVRRCGRLVGEARPAHADARRLQRPVHCAHN